MFTKVHVHVLFVMLMVASAAVAQDAPKQITFGEKHDVDPAVSPDGRQLVFSSDRTGAYNLFLANLNEDKVGFVQLTQGKKDDRFPCWTPDSKKIVFSSKRTGNGDLYQTTADGSAGFLQLTDSEFREECPAFRPKTPGIAYATGPKQVIKTGSKLNIALMNMAGDNRAPIILGQGDEPKFSPDGGKILFTSHRTKNNDIWVMNVDGGHQTQLTNDPKDDINPAYAPDGKKIVFASNRTGNYDLWMMDPDGANQRQLTTSLLDETQPAWSVGGYLYYTLRSSETKSNIYRIKAP